MLSVPSRDIRTSYGQPKGNSPVFFKISFFPDLEFVELQSEKPRNLCNVL